FLASIGGGKSAIVLAAPATLRVGQLAFKRGPATKPKNQIQCAAVLKPGQWPGVAPDKKAKLRRVAMTVAVGDMKGNLWTVNVASGDVRVRGRTLVAKTGKKSPLRLLRVRVAADGTFHVAARSALFNLSAPGGASVGHNFDGNNAVILAPPCSGGAGGGGGGGTALMTPPPRRGRSRGGRGPRRSAQPAPASAPGRLKAVQPRSQAMTAPVRLDASSDARKTASAAISSGGCSPMAWSFANASRSVSLSKMSAFMGVST